MLAAGGKEDEKLARTALKPEVIDSSMKFI
jgi:hypothetical protein